MKRVFLYAYDKSNLGDDLFIQYIVKRYPDVHFYIWTDARNRQNFLELSNLKILDKNSNVVQLLGRVRPSLAVRYKNWWEKRCDASVYIGGSIFIEYEAWKKQINWLTYQAENRNFFVLGANFGPYKTESYREQLNEVFFKMQDVCLRDKYSLGKFLGNPKVRYAPDILFSYPMPKRSIKEKQVFVSVINAELHDDGVYDHLYVKNMAKILQEYLKDGCSLILASFCQAEGDEIAIKKILATMNRDNSQIRTIAYDGTNAEKVVTALAESDYVIASRFHAMILGMVAERPVLPIIYSDKTKNVLIDLKFEGNMFDIRNDEIWDYALSRQNWDCQLGLVSKNIKIASKSHFEKLDELLR